MSLSSYITLRWKSDSSERSLFKYSTLLGTKSPSRLARHPRTSYYISDASVSYDVVPLHSKASLKNRSKFSTRNVYRVIQEESALLWEMIV